jgi:cytochrome c oxidase subunit 2
MTISTCSWRIPRRRSALCAAALSLALADAASPVTASQGSQPRVIEVVARKFAFEPALIEVAEGEPVVLLVKSLDNAHGFAIKQFKIDKDIPAGQEVVKIEFTPRQVGEFPMLCTVLCGDGHLDMVGKLTVVARKVEAPQ